MRRYGGRCTNSPPAGRQTCKHRDTSCKAAHVGKKMFYFLNLRLAEQKSCIIFCNHQLVTTLIYLHPVVHVKSVTDTYLIGKLDN